MRESLATERNDFLLCILSLNAALLGLPEPKSVLHSLISICYTCFFALFQIVRGDVNPPPPPPRKKIEGDVSPVPRDRRPCSLQPKDTN